ncbi:methyltransferase type 11 [Brevibacterium sp. 50QC2O2]|uniref:putative RNA methyltransferase n=1 Tax=Brevibacterium sp. 50QC2O2 TaxID=2968459 RepID=UPI00211C3D83|nr:methyltransferase type 11 [Brevibacterium sp. 50QC2O2]
MHPDQRSRPANAPSSTAAPTTRERVLARLRCPVCAEPLQAAEHDLRCPAGHSFNIARQGYFGLLSGFKATSGDDAAMALARDAFLASGAYAPLAAEVAAQAAAVIGPAADPFIVEAGCGTGYYLAKALERIPPATGFGFDTGVRGRRLAAHAHPRAAVGSWDVYRPFPLAKACADVVLDVFSPRNPAEFRRVLGPTGGVVIARPTAQHLRQLRAEVVDMVHIDPAKEARLHRAFDSDFTETHSATVEFDIHPDLDQARALVAMTPSARHLDPATLTAAQVPEVITASVIVSTWRPRG